MKYSEIIDILNRICPEDLAEEWDNSGEQISFTNKEIRNILVALDITKAVIDEAKSKSIDLIITHHPLYFSPINLISDDGLGYTTDLIKSDISVYSCHTNFDKIMGGNNDFIGNLLEVSDVIVADNTEGFGRIGSLKEEMSISDFAKKITEKMPVRIDEIRLIGDNTSKVKKICWCSGAGADLLLTNSGLELGADLYITGDIKYHEAMFALESGMNVLDIGHFGSEIIFIPNMVEKLKKALPEQVNIIPASSDKNPFSSLR